MQPKFLEHVVVYRDESYYAGWPFNGGFWQFADGELAVGFIRGQCDYRAANATGHDMVDSHKGEHVILRSTDGGRSWPEESMRQVYKRPEFDKRLKEKKPSLAAEKGFDPKADGFCLISGFGIPPKDAPNTMFITVSTDRGYSWHEPVVVPGWSFAELGGRPSYIVRDDGLVLLFGHGSRKGSESMAVPLIWGSWDGGASWGLIGEMDLTPSRPIGIMPFPLRLDDGPILASIRRQYDAYNAYTQIYQSTDDGRTWSFLSRVNDWGAPAALAQLGDGRLVCVYGYRQKPWGIRARISRDRGATWGEEIVLRDDGGSWDLGYPRLLLRPDGKLITVYYMNDAAGPIQMGGGVRHIAATIFEV